MLATERNHFRRYDSLIAKMWVVFRLGFKEPLLLCKIVDREEIFDSGLFKDGLFVFLLTPIIAAIEFDILVEQSLRGFFVLHWCFLLMIINTRVILQIPMIYD